MPGLSQQFEPERQNGPCSRHRISRVTTMIQKSLALSFLILLSFCTNIEEGSNTGATATETLEPFEQVYSVKCIDTVQHESGTAAAGFETEKAKGPPRGAGETAGSTDVFVIGEGGSAVFSVSGFVLKNEPGDDFKIFENGFKTGDGTVMSWDLGTVEVSAGGSGTDMSAWSWYGWPVTYSGDPDKTAGKSGFAGMTPVVVHETNNRIDPQLEAAGGDGFDLAQARHIDSIGDGNPLNYTYGNSLEQNGITTVSYIRIRDSGSHIDDAQVFSNGVDIDAVCLFHFAQE